jgi:hypothetical protein
MGSIRSGFALDTGAPTPGVYGDIGTAGAGTAAATLSLRADTALKNPSNTG